jgi:hypothetical protein
VRILIEARALPTNRPDTFTQTLPIALSACNPAADHTFFQVGAGVAIDKVDRAVFNIPPGRSSADAQFALVFGAGLSIDVGKNAFVRPELRSYWFVGPTVVLLPALSMGWRF